MGKKGKIIKKGIVLESEFITRDPQDVIDLAFGSGYGIGAANSFETLWELAHRKDFIHKRKLNEIMSKFLVNLKSMRQDVPSEAATKYPEILGEGIEDVLIPKSQEEVLSAAIYQYNNNPSPGTLKIFHDEGILKLLPQEEVTAKFTELFDGLSID